MRNVRLRMPFRFGIDHQERNGYHYLGGLDMLTPAEQQQALADHPDMYLAGRGLAQLRIDDGRLPIDSLLKQPSLGLTHEPP